VQNFKSNVDVNGTFTGSNIKMGSIIGGERLDNQVSNGMIIQPPEDGFALKVADALLKTSEVMDHIPVLGSAYNFGFKSTVFLGDSTMALIYGTQPPPVSNAYDAIKDAPFVGTPINVFETSRDTTIFLIDGVKGNSTPSASEAAHLAEQIEKIGVEIIYSPY
jgi:hypothetical protein